MQKKLKKLKGETLIEVLIAVSILALIVMPASALYVQSSFNIAINKNDLIATTIAESGIEVIRGFRDTNLLKFSSKTVDCWNAKPNHNDIDNCEDDKIEPGFYQLNLNINTLNWELISASTGLSADLSKPTDADYRLKLFNNLYNYKTGTDTDFYHEITIENIELADKYDGHDAIKIVSRVLYRLGNKIHTVKRVQYLTRILL